VNSDGVPPISTSSAYTVEDQERMKRAHALLSVAIPVGERRIGGRVLEIGCGLGNFTRLLADRELVIASTGKGGY